MFLAKKNGGVTRLAESSLIDRSVCYLTKSRNRRLSQQVLNELDLLALFRANTVMGINLYLVFFLPLR